MLCDLCFRMLRGQDGRIWRGTYDLHFNHHKTIRELKRSKNMNCGICRVLYAELESKLELSLVNKLNPEVGGTPAITPTTTPKSPSPTTTDENIEITACLSVLDHHQVKHLYRLDFKLRYEGIRSRRTFVLKKTDFGDPPFRTPISDDTSSDEVFQLAWQWITKCRCADKPPTWYPKRLISMENLKTQDFLDIRKMISTGHLKKDKLDEIKVHLVETEDWEGGRPDGPNVRYVTLSHCWGPNPGQQLKLDSSTYQEFREGIRLDKLPKTFRDAVEFASRLPRVGYIWIDSLCIKQGKEDKDDWLSQSAVMDQVYHESFLNISATASKSSAEGLFRPRRPELLLEDEVTLNIDGIPGAKAGDRVLERPAPKISAEDTVIPANRQPSFLRQCTDYWFVHAALLLLRIIQTVLSEYVERKTRPESVVDSVRHGRASSMSGQVVHRDESPSRESDHSGDGDPKNLRRCTILDVSFWKNTIDQAPVNTRGWVLQERLMAPRVLHFCHDQIAWECSEFDAAEGQPQGIPKFQLTSDGIVEESGLKGLHPVSDGRKLRRVRLKGYSDPDLHLRPQIYAFELWRRIVEVYSRTAITMPEDKLIALSGMARWMATRIGNRGRPEIYVAGLWRTHLASQLLWKVEPVFRELDSSFQHLSESSHEYRAPSFSWASVDANRGNGVVYGEVTDRDLFIEIDSAHTTPKSKTNKYGMVENGHIFLWGKLRKATLSREDKGRFCWHLVDRGELDAESHTNVYLDCSRRDTQDDSYNVLGSDAGIYVLPAAKGERVESEESKYIICLLLQLVEGAASRGHKGPTFRRIGLTKLSPWADKDARHHILDVYQSDVDMPHQGYDAETGRHRILLI